MVTRELELTELTRKTWTIANIPAKRKKPAAYLQRNTRIMIEGSFAETHSVPRSDVIDLGLDTSLPHSILFQSLVLTVY